MFCLVCFWAIMTKGVCDYKDKLIKRILCNRIEEKCDLF